MYVTWKTYTGGLPFPGRTDTKKKHSLHLTSPGAVACIRLCVCAGSKGCDGIPFNSTGRRFSAAYFPQFLTFNYSTNARGKLPPEWEPPMYICGSDPVSYESETGTFHRFFNWGYRPKREPTTEMKIRFLKAGWRENQ